MTRHFLCCITAIFIISFGCQKSGSPTPNREEAFFSSEQEVAEKLAKFTGKLIATSNINNISFIHTTSKTYAFVFYDGGDGPKNLVISRSYGANGIFERESVSSCDGSSCTCKVQATIDNQGNVTIGCSCAGCLLISEP